MKNKDLMKPEDKKCDETRAHCFVIQPFGKKTHPKTGKEINNDDVYEELRKLQNLIPSFPICISRANIGNIRKEDLHEHVITRLNESDFCIADLNGGNLNVLYEAGYAKGIGLHVILICQDPDEIPTDLKKYFWVQYSMTNLTELSTKISEHLDVVKDKVQKRRKEKETKVECFETRASADIRSRILNAKNKIDILQTNLITIATDYLQQLLDSMRSNKNLRLRLLTLNPQSIFVNYRGQQVGYKDNVGLYRQELDGNLQSVHFALREFGERVEIRIYDDFPSQIVFFSLMMIYCHA